MRAWCTVVLLALGCGGQVDDRADVATCVRRTDRLEASYLDEVGGITSCEKGVGTQRHRGEIVALGADFVTVECRSSDCPAGQVRLDVRADGLDLSKGLT